MRKIIPLLLIVTLFSCKQKIEKTEAQPEVPKALQENREKSIISYAKRGADDLVDELYNEKLEGSVALSAFEKKFRDLSKGKIDSLEVFHDFDSKNQQYYASANNHLNRIQDSFLKHELKTAFENNNNAYKRSISQLNILEDHLEEQFVSTTDRRLALKLFVTLNMMNEFKKSNQPALATLENVLNSFKMLNKQLDSAIVKNKSITYSFNCNNF
jgi:hypothetical protein